MTGDSDYYSGCWFPAPARLTNVNFGALCLLSGDARRRNENTRRLGTLEHFSSEVLHSRLTHTVIESYPHLAATVSVLKQAPGLDRAPTATGMWPVAPRPAKGSACPGRTLIFATRAFGSVSNLRNAHGVLRHLPANRSRALSNSRHHGHHR
jgi:hypothetical protein